ncbi:hypothetical protein BGZ97_011017 [Linnemannia gamsii]|uniref:ParB/Spo0J HTH domain-containing protein n=1 Tax=Linnemannia gamsii TaxID=64522 RepID=A0A9P6RR24_9FUNG|nr:hypothetical protein BGZ97_011017 [Linnemannia gamsii]
MGSGIDKTQCEHTLYDVLVDGIAFAEPVQVMLVAGDLDMGHARALLAVDAAAQITLANQIVNRRLSVREAEKLMFEMLIDLMKIKLLWIKFIVEPFE